MDSLSEFERREIAILEAARATIAGCSALLITSGSGMSFESQVPDLRDTRQLWSHFPALAIRGLKYHDMYSPYLFDYEPQLASGFFSSLNVVYESATPHQGFDILREFAESKPRGYYVFTTAVDSFFQRSGFQSVDEAHGSLSNSQCAVPCRHERLGHLFNRRVEFCPKTLMTEPFSIPRCKFCGAIARPAVMMNGDGTWLDDDQSVLETRMDFKNWLDNLEKAILKAKTKPDRPELCILEIGAGPDSYTARYQSEAVLKRFGGAEAGIAKLIRINPIHYQVPKGNISIPITALAAIKMLFK